MPDEILIRGARLHNLKNITLAIPKNRLVVLTGISGSGKSTLGFDLLYKESQRQYMQALGWVEWGVSRPPVDWIRGLSPAVSVDQHLANRSPRSTVGTATDVYTYLRILFARLGQRPCPACGKDVPPGRYSTVIEWEDDASPQETPAAPVESFPCPHCGALLAELDMADFSFNKPAGACPACTGLGVVQAADLRQIVDDHKSIQGGAVSGWDGLYLEYNLSILQAAARYYEIPLDLALPVGEFSLPLRDLLYYGTGSPQFQRHFPGKKEPATVRTGRFEGVATNLMRRYAEHIHAHSQEEDYHDRLEQAVITRVCPECAGTRLRPESRAVKLAGETIVELSRLPLIMLGAWVDALPAALEGEENLIAAPILVELSGRIERLVQAGAGYLSAERASPTLSAGEAQRLRLAAMLGSGLSGVLYVLDEPTIGLHQRDTHRLMEVLRRLRDLGNTVLVIEHDLETIAAADYVVDFGPGAGKHGGQVVAAGSPAEVAAAPGSLTGAYLSGQASIPLPESRRAPGENAIVLRGARQNNLKDLTVRIPLGLLVAVTGVSGSGKSTLVFGTLERAVRQHLAGGADLPGEYDVLEGAGQVARVITISQEPIGRIPRSNAATYADIYTPIRETFAAEPEARQRGLTARSFSFNVPGGRCERCEGAGVLAVKMYFMPDVETRCPVCHGRRFTREVLAVLHRGLDIARVLELTVEEALAVFEDVPAARSRLQLLSDVGLGYLQLGQPATMLSGGEAQRVRLAKELGRKVPAQTLYLLDEPTTGLHLADTARLLGVLQRLVDAGNTVIVVEHNLELVKTADWVIDLGPEGGAAGGSLVAEGTPEQVAQIPASYTGQYLRAILSAGRRPGS